MAEGNLVDYLTDRIGQSLRGVVRYDGNDTDTLYLRDDLKETRLQSQIDRMIERLRPESAPAEEAAFPFGDLHVTVRCFDEAIILHFPTGRDEGVVVAVEPNVAMGLTTFAKECSELISR
jgi:hypothetical protein